MKKVFFTAIIATALLLVSCVKDDITTKQSSITNDENVNRIKVLVDGFKSRMNSDFKSSASLSVDSAEWYIETTLNFCYGNSGDFMHTVTDSVKCVIGCNGNTVNMSDVAVAYDGMLRGISDTYYSISNEDKSFDYVNIELNYLDNGDIELTGYYSVGIDRKDVVVTTTNTVVGFGPTDYWTPTNELGKCDIYKGQCIGRDASTELDSICKKIHIPRFPYKFGYKLVWTDLETILIYGGEIWQGHFSDCLSPQEMNYLLWTSVPNALKKRIPNGKYCKELYYWGSIVLGINNVLSPSADSHCVHNIDLIVGVPIYVPYNDGIEIMPKI